MVLPCLLSCAAQPPEKADDDMRVSASHGLTCLNDLDGSSAHAAELVYLSAQEVAVLEDTGDSGGTEVALLPQPNVGVSARALCASLYAEEVMRKTADDTRCVVTFRSPQAKQRGMQLLRLELGPFQLERVIPVGKEEGSTACIAANAEGNGSSQLLGRIELTRRNTGEPADHGQIRTIHIIPVPLKDQWRSLFAGEVDVVPSMPMMYGHWFADMESIRTVPLPTSSYLALYFNTAAESWSDVDMRRTLARSLDLNAIAEIACRDSQCRNPEPEQPELGGTIQPPREPRTLPQELTVHVLDSDSSGVAAAKMIKNQLRRRHGIAVHIAQHPVTEMTALAAKGSFGMLILPLSIPAVAGGQDFLGRLDGVARYTHDALRTATLRGDYARAAAILSEDVPVVPLFRYLQFAAMDVHLCGGQPTSQTSWRWLADLYRSDSPCPDGEVR